MTDDKPWLSGEPYYCKTCGVGFAEYVACEDGGCELESKEEAMKRRREAGAPETATTRKRATAMDNRFRKIAGMVRPQILTAARKRNLLNKCFEAFAEKVYPGAPPEQIHELKVSFMAGAAELHAVMMYAGDLSTDEDLKFMEGVADEIETFHLQTIAKAEQRDAGSETSH